MFSSLKIKNKKSGREDLGPLKDCFGIVPKFVNHCNIGKVLKKSKLKLKLKFYKN